MQKYRRKTAHLNSLAPKSAGLHTHALQIMTSIKNLGPCGFLSPLQTASSLEIKFRTDSERVLVKHQVDIGGPPIRPEDPDVASFEVAGPREKIFFDPARTTAGIVTVDCARKCARASFDRFDIASGSSTPVSSSR